MTKLINLYLWLTMLWISLMYRIFYLARPASLTWRNLWIRSSISSSCTYWNYHGSILPNLWWVKHYYLKVIYQLWSSFWREMWPENKKITIDISYFHTVVGMYSSVSGDSSFLLLVHFILLVSNSLWSLYNKVQKFYE